MKNLTLAFLLMASTNAFSAQIFETEFTREVRQIDHLRPTPEVTIFNSKKEILYSHAGFSDEQSKIINTVLQTGKGEYKQESSEERKARVDAQVARILPLVKKDLESNKNIPPEVLVKNLQKTEDELRLAYGAPPLNLDEIINNLQVSRPQISKAVSKSKTIVVTFEAQTCEPCGEVKSMLEERLDKLDKNIVWIKVARR